MLLQTWNWRWIWQTWKDFKKLSSNKQFESREVLCDYICAAPYGYHKCFSDEDFERFAGCDLTKFNDSYDEVKQEVTEHFPCKNCGKNFKEDEHLQEHFEQMHEKDDDVYCPLKKCDFKSKSVSSIVMHIGVDHHDLVQKKLSWKGTHVHRGMRFCSFSALYTVF